MQAATIHRLFHGQDRLLNDTEKDEHAIVGGFGAGKTVAGVRWHSKRCVDNKDSPESIVVAPNYQLLANRCLPEYIRHLESMGMREEWGDFQVYRSPQNMKLVYHWGHTVFFLSGNTPANIVSYNASHIWLDEPAIMEEAVVQAVVARLRCNKARYRQLLFTGTPEGLNWFYNRFGPHECGRKEGTPFSENATKLVLHARSFDNPTLPASYFRMLRKEYGFDAALFANYVLGLWTSLSKDRFYFKFDELRHIGDYPPMPELKEIILCMDNNVGQMTWVALQPFKGTYLAVKDNDGRGQNIDASCEQFIDAFPPNVWGNHKISVMGDPSIWQRQIQGTGSDGGYDVIREKLTPFYPNLTIDAPNVMPTVEARNRVTNRILAENRLLMDRGCKKLTMSAKAAEFDGKGKVKKGPKDKHTHAMEAVDMALVVLEPNQHSRDGFVGIK